MPAGDSNPRGYGTVQHRLQVPRDTQAEPGRPQTEPEGSQPSSHRQVLGHGSFHMAFLGELLEGARHQEAADQEGRCCESHRTEPPTQGRSREPLGRWPRGLPRCSWPATTRTHASRSGAPGGRPKAASEVNHGAGCVVKQEEEPRQTAQGGREQRWRRPAPRALPGAAGRRRAA